MEELTNSLHKLKQPNPNDKVYKDECIFSFENPESPDGLFICLTTFKGFSKDFLKLYTSKTGNNVFLNIKRFKHPIEKQSDGPESKVTRLAIGVADGFNPDSPQFRYEEKYEIVVVTDMKIHTFPYPHDIEKLPKVVQVCVEGILKAESAFRVAEKEALSTWDGEARITTKHTNLLQLNNGKKIPPSGWKCENINCDLTNNLWLNLTDGSILCGRKFYDGTGGNDHAVEHYKNTNYPLAVKLGTISRDGKADVYSYDEDDMVEDPNLAVHLAHWGINITQMEKTEKSMVELELDLNQKFGEWIAQQEQTNQLSPCNANHAGLINLGSSCYLNSVMQMIFAIPNFVEQYFAQSQNIFQNYFDKAPEDFNIQMGKLASGLLSGKYPEGIAPRTFRTFIGRGHPEFSTNRQQDAQEFILHLINMLNRNVIDDNLADYFKYQIEERYQCSSGKVKYQHRPEYLLPLPIPMDAVINKKEVEEYEAIKKSQGKNTINQNPVRAKIELESCLEKFAASESVEQFYSSALQDKTTASKTTRLASFPPYLLIHLKKFTMEEDWTCVKLDVAIDMPEVLDLEHLRGNGLQEGEELLPEASQAPAPVYDQILLGQLTEMGFPIEACKRALYFTENRGLEPATQWLMEHISDSDFSDTFVPPGIDAKKESVTFTPIQEHVEMLMNMGFTKEQAAKALKETNNILERAADWAFSHINELDSMGMEVEIPAEPKFKTGKGLYKLMGFITHMGTSTMVGHYVCYLLENKKWILYNDEKVFVAEKPAKELGYIYLYKRMDDFDTE
ncbi:ubiquitin carboxyl-terminal hydrolase 5 [Trichogramma pretiosum]|uniref:ubiquitin carboxyl-terminal hydrolase 5 n=1 Tax=Trichogramma pretiosum TaxID=7493 RepID=UPI0006C98CC3|nr:ubiquitin carboxyl-terminal hydrolase 5 [Trichogramma pretiosum]XP_014223511.1 ubiquitin carboxyl-terminal hydrolase 5 [Trichogramma pretiosum]